RKKRRRARIAALTCDFVAVRAANYGVGPGVFVGALEFPLEKLVGVEARVDERIDRRLTLLVAGAEGAHATAAGRSAAAARLKVDQRRAAGARIGRVRIERRLGRDGRSHAAGSVQNEQDVGLGAAARASGEDLAVIGERAGAANDHRKRSRDEALPAGLEYLAHGESLGYIRCASARRAVCR